MIKTIFRFTFLIGLSVLLLCGILFFGIQYTQNREETYTALQEQAVYAEQGLRLNGTDYLEALKGENHLTWFERDGAVLYDSESASAGAEQKEFPEVRDAFSKGEGHSIRKSDTTGESMMYYARLREDGTVLRLSCHLSDVKDALRTVSPVMWVLVLVLIISGILAFRVARQIVKPINDLDLDRPSCDTYPELAPLIGKIQEQKLTIQEEVAQRENLRREFSANVSHELRTPLTSISGFAELMAQGVVEESKVQEFSRDIYKESQRLIALIDDIMRISKLDEGAEGPEKEPVDLYDISSEVLDSLRPVADKRGISLQLTGGSAVVPGIRQLLSEMIYNLCDNAVKYNVQYGIVTVDVSQEEGETCLSVTDTGIGIPPEHQKRVFERFYRVDKSHSKEIGGTGLGLSIVKHGAQFHDARVELKSEPGVGTQVRLIFQKPENGGQDQEEKKD